MADGHSISKLVKRADYLPRDIILMRHSITCICSALPLYTLCTLVIKTNHGQLNPENMTKNKERKHKDSGGASRPLGHIHIFSSQGCKVSL